MNIENESLMTSIRMLKQRELNGSLVWHVNKRTKADEKLVGYYARN
jgi:hypothetical protein